MLKGLVLIVGMMIAIVCLSISYGYHDEYQRNKRWPYYKDEPDKNIKSIIWLGIGTIIVFLTKLLLDYIG
jgi:hypothetical protein